jgi:hypothetical protein
VANCLSEKKMMDEKIDEFSVIKFILRIEFSSLKIKLEDKSLKEKRSSVVQIMKSKKIMLAKPITVIKFMDPKHHFGRMLKISTRVYF